MLYYLMAGTCNRVLELDFDNGSQLIPKISVAGLVHLTTLNEVATIRCVREILDLPVPRVLGWCARADATPFNSECIFMEKIQGVPLYQH
jgi:hypothetical protein